MEGLFLVFLLGVGDIVGAEMVRSGGRKSHIRQSVRELVRFVVRNYVIL